MPTDRTTFAKSLRRTKLSTIPPAKFDAMQAASTAGADIVQLDLENATPVDQKEAARHGVLDGLARIDWGESEVWVRVNNADSGLLETDVDTVVAGVPDALILAKTTTAAEVRYVAELVAAAESKHGVASGRIKLGVVIESALGLTNLDEILAADARMTSLSLGASDLAADCGFWRDPTGPELELLYARGRCVVAARVAGVDTCDSAYPYVDLPGVIRSTERSLNLGFTTKTCHGVSQVAPIHGVFALRG